MASASPSLSSSTSCASGVPSASQSGGGGVAAAACVLPAVVVVAGLKPGVVVAGAVGPTGAAPAKTIGDRDFFVAGPSTFVKTATWKRVSWPLTRNLPTAAGTTTSMRVLVALRGRTRTLLPSVAREKKTRLCDAPEAKFFP